MTAQQRYGPRADAGYADRAAYERIARERAAREREAAERVMYVYGDRICGKTSKQRQLYKTYGKAAGFSPESQQSSRSTRRGAAPRRSRRKIVMENIINLFESVEQRGREAVAAAKKNAVMQKRLTEHRRGFFLSLFMAAVFVAFVLLVYNLFFGIRTIYAENTKNYTEAEIIAASGVVEGDKLYSFRADETERRITFHCPYIRSVDVTRTIPNRIGFDVTSDFPQYWVNVYGTNLVLTEGLRVLGEYDPAKHPGVVRLYLPEIRYSVTGRTLVFADERDERYVRTALNTLCDSELSDRVVLFDLRDSQNLTMYCNNIYLLRFGNMDGLARKMKLAEQTIIDGAFNEGTPAEMDLTVMGEASVRYDHTLHLAPQTETGEY